jgi:hypothetical protein
MCLFFVLVYCRFILGGGKSIIFRYGIWSFGGKGDVFGFREVFWSTVGLRFRVNVCLMLRIMLRCFRLSIGSRSLIRISFII